MNYLDEVKLQIDRCSKCGTCRAYCPIFEINFHEPLVARGKIQLARAYLAGDITSSEKLEEIFSQCLLCKSCTAACPNGVETSAIVSAARVKLARERGLPLLKRVGFKYLLPSNRGLAYLAQIIRLTKVTHLTRLAHKMRLWDLFPGRAGNLEKLLPVPARTPLRDLYPGYIKPQHVEGRVAYFTGCMTHLVYPSVGHAVIRVLNSLNQEVYLPEQVCCGAPALTHGDLDTFKRLAERNIKSFSRQRYDAIIVDCASCGTTWKEYARWTGLAEAGELAGRVVDISQYIVEEIGLERLAVNLREKKHTEEKIVTYHDPCHLKKGLKVDAAPRELLKVLPGVKFREMDGADRCCGAAGSYCFLNYDLSQEIVKQKTAAIVATGASIVATACPSCTMQIAHALREAGHARPVLHVAELLAGSIK